MDSYKTEKLKNGLRVLTMNNKENDIINLNIKINIGWDIEKKDNLEVAHFFEHLFCQFTSTKYNDGKQNRKELSLRTIEVDAETSNKHILFSLEFKKKHFKYVGDVILNALLDFKIDSNIFKQEKNAVIEELNDLIKDSDYKFDKKINSIIYKNHSRGYSQEERLQNTKKMTETMILKYFKHYFNSNNILIGIYGNLDKQLYNDFKMYLSEIKKGAIIRYNPFNLNFKVPIIYYKKDANISNLRICFKVDTTMFNDKKYIINALLYILIDNQFYSLIMNKLRMEEGLVYYCIGDLELDEIDIGMSNITISTLCNTNNLLKVIKYILEILDKVKTSLIEESYLHSYKEYKKMEYTKLKTNKDPNDLLQFYLSQYLWNKKIVPISHHYKKYDNVGLEQLRTISRKIFNKDNMVICYDGRKKLDKEIKELSKII